ncbi:hypothetical protein BHE74_00059752 [Ensete ventricosum]|nr:hypothetical protein BHE74_00059752 [Ensete ventricosum]
MKKYDGHKHYAKSRPESSFDWFYVHHLGNSKYWPFTMYSPMVSRMSMVSRKNRTVINFTLSRVSIDFSCTVSKIQNTGHSRCISHGKSYEHDFTKKCDGHKLCVESSFDRFFLSY